MSLQNSSTGTFKIKLPAELMAAVQGTSLDSNDDMDVFKSSLFERIKGWLAGAAGKKR